MYVQSLLIVFLIHGLVTLHYLLILHLSKVEGLAASRGEYVYSEQYRYMYTVKNGVRCPSSI